MDNIAHTLCGVTMARAGLRNAGPLATTAAVVGANLPDADIAWSFGDLAYLDYHRGFTHSIAGVAVLTLALWATLLAIDRLFRQGRAERARPGPLLLACLCGVGSHLAMDATNSYGVRPFLPWSDRWYYGDLFVIVDPWIWWMLGSAVFLSRSRRALRIGAWTLAAGLVTSLILSVDVVPTGARVVWLAGLVVVVVLARAGVGKGTRIPRVALAAFLAYGLTCFVAGRVAAARLDRLLLAHDEPVVRTAVLPRPADPTRWDAIVEGPADLEHRVIGVVPFLDPGEAAFRRYPLGFDLPGIETFLASRDGGIVMRFFRFPFARIETDRDGSRALVVRDARFAREGGGFGTYSMPLAD